MQYPEYVAESARFSSTMLCGLRFTEVCYPGLVLRQLGYIQIVPTSSKGYHECKELTGAEIELIASSWRGGHRMERRRRLPSQGQELSRRYTAWLRTCAFG